MYLKYNKMIYAKYATISLLVLNFLCVHVIRINIIMLNVVINYNFYIQFFYNNI